MKTIVHPANSRGHANHGWLDTYHTFSFAGYFSPERIHFGALRVLNDDTITGGSGFGTHPHDNMEIISIPISGSIAHRDSMGNVQAIKEQEVQVMSAGSGVTHSEFNASATEKANFLQIWIIPDKADIQPRYAQRAYKPEDRINQLQTVAGPDTQPEEGVLPINQQAWINLGTLQKGFSTAYALRNPENGVYLFVIKGRVKAGDTELGPRDGAGFSETARLSIETLEDAEILLMEVPMLNLR